MKLNDIVKSTWLVFFALVLFGARAGAGDKEAGANLPIPVGLEQLRKDLLQGLAAPDGVGSRLCSSYPGLPPRCIDWKYRLMELARALKEGPHIAPADQDLRFLADMLFNGWADDEAMQTALLDDLIATSFSNLTNYAMDKKALLRLKQTPWVMQFTDMDGRQIDLARLRGRPFIVALWAPGCGGSRKQIPKLRKLHEKYSSEGLQIIGLTKLGPHGEKYLRAFMAEEGISWPQEIDDAKWRACFDAFSFQWISNLLLFDINGRLLRAEPGPSLADWERLIREQLNTGLNREVKHLVPTSLLAKSDRKKEAVTVRLAAVPAEVQVGQEIELQLTLSVEAPWQVFGDTLGFGGQQKLKIDMKLPPGIEALGGWQWPDYETVFEDFEVHVYEAGEHVFRRKLKIGAGDGPLTLAAQITYQACNPEYCGPVRVEQLSTELQIGSAGGTMSMRATAGEVGKSSTTVEMPARGESINGTALDMRFVALDGRAVDIGRMLGSVILVDFWASWCVPCVAELPSIKSIYDKYRHRGFSVVGVTFDDMDTKEKLIRMIREKQLTWPQRFDGRKLDQEAAQRYGIQGIPATFLIDKYGRLVETNIRGKALELAIEKYLAL